MRLTLLLSLMMFFSAGIRAEELLVVVHPENPVPELGLSAMKAYILQNKSKWEDGQPIHYLIPPRGSKIFNSLIHDLLDMDETQWDTYWERQQVYGKTAPRVVPDELVIIRNVTKDVLALGVIADSALTGEIRKRVKIIFRVKF